MIGDATEEMEEIGKAMFNASAIRTTMGGSLTVFEAVCFYDLDCLVNDVRHVDLLSENPAKTRSGIDGRWTVCIAEAGALVRTRSKFVKEDRTHTDDVFCARLRGEHAENTSTASNVEDSLVLEKVGVVYDGISVRPRADRVLQHLFVNTCGLKREMRHRKGSMRPTDTYQNERRSRHNCAAAGCARGRGGTDKRRRDAKKRTGTD